MKPLNWLKPGGIASVVLAVACAVGLFSVGVTAEVPVGGVTGHVQMGKEGVGLPHADVIIERKTQDGPEGATIFYAETDSAGDFAYRGLPTGSYVVRVYGKAHEIPGAPVKVEEGKTQHFDWSAPRSPDQLSINAGSRVFRPGEPVKVRADGITEAATLTLKVLKVKEESFSDNQSLTDLFYGITSGRNRKDPQTLASFEPAIEQTEELKTKDIEGAYVHESTLDGLGYGVFLIQVTVGKESQFAWVTVTDIALVTKTDPKHGEAFVCDIESGKPVSGADIALTRNGKRVDVGKSGDDGRAKFDPIQGDERMTLVSARHGESHAYTWFYKPYSDGEPVAMHMVTDRPLYRPGDTAHFKAALRRGEPGAYKIPAGETATVSLTNTDGDEIKRFTAKVDEWGAIQGDVPLSKEELQGEYGVEVTLGKQSLYGYIGLASYRKPQFEIEVVPSAEKVVRGDELKFTIRCTSLTGEPVVGAKVNADLYSGYQYASSPFEDEYYADWSDDYGLEFNRQYEVVTDANGEATVRVDTGRVAGEQKYADFSDTSFRLEASVSDEGGRYFSADGKAVAYRGEFDVRADFQKYVANPGQSVTLELQSAGTAKAETPASVEVRFGREVFGERGFKFVEEAKQEVALANKSAMVAFTPKKSGSYKAEVTARDSRGNLVKTDAYLWVAGGSEFDAKSGLTATLDKRQYQIGDTAQVVVQTDTPGSCAWLTTEGEGILSSQVIEFKGNEAIIQIPITSDYAPNFSVSVCQVAGKSFDTVSRPAKVGLEDRDLVVTVTPDRKEVHPGETVHLTVETKGRDGKAVAADVALRAVDEGIYQLREDTENGIESFYPERWSNVSTEYSFPAAYLDGEDKGGAEVTIRKDFADTAFWQGGLHTDASGRATVSVKLPDNLTDWRVTASALSKDTRYGKGVAHVVARKELMLRMSLPQFLTQDDRQEVAFTVTNATDSDMAVAYELTASGLKIEGEPRGTVKVAARTRGVVRRTVAAGLPGTATLRMVARSGSFSDGVEMKVSTHPRTESQREFATGALSAGKGFSREFSLDRKAVGGTLTLTVAPSYFAALEPVLSDLIDYPYGCVEQTMSRFVPAVLVRQYWRETNQPHPALDAKINEATRIGFERLRALQNDNGTFGWFAYDQVDPEMTALVLDGLYRISAAGVHDGDDLAARTLDGARKAMAELDLAKEGERRRWLPLAAAAAKWQDAPEIRKILDGPLDKLTDRELADVAEGWTSLRRLGAADPDPAAKGAAAWAKLKKAATQTSETAGFADPLLDSAGIELALAWEPESGFAEKLVSHLMASRDPHGWGDTWRTSEALKASVTYVRAKGFEPASGTAKVLVNGEEAGSIALEASGQAKTVTVPFAALKSGGNKVEIQYVGTGAAPFAVELEQDVYAQTSQPASNPPGFRIQRSYVPMEVTKLEDGSQRLLPSKRTSESYRSGQVFRCRLTLTTDTDLDYVAIEDPVPSNCRIVDADEPESGYDWTNWWSNSTFGDDRAAFFIWNLPKGQHTIEYAIRAEAPGLCNALPARAFPMYLRDVSASTGQNRVEVKP